MIKKNFINLIFLVLIVNLIYGMTEMECINNPTAEVIDYGIGEVDIRMYAYGGVIAKFIFAPFNRLNFGGSLDIDRVMGSEEPQLRDPVFYFKWRIFDGTQMFPSVALGYDGQGYNFVGSEYLLPAKGLFLVFTMNLITEKFFCDFGTNVTKYNGENKLFGFINCRFVYQEIFSLGLEYENIGKREIQQMNLKLGLILAKVLYLDFIFNNLYSESPKVDRQLRINYLYKFF